MKYRIIQNKYPDGSVDFRAEKRVLWAWVEIGYGKPFPEPAVFKSPEEVENWITDGRKSNRVDLSPTKSIVKTFDLTIINKGA
jgi:hypothetical protein